MGSVEIAMTNNGWSGAMLMSPTGDVQLLVDTPGSPLATTQRLYRLILTNAMTLDDEGNPIAPADDRFNVNWGASTRASVGEMFTDTLAQEITARVLGALAGDYAVAQSPAPIVTVTYLGNGVAELAVQVYVTTGELLTLPTALIKVA